MLHLLVLLIAIVMASATCYAGSGGNLTSKLSSGVTTVKSIGELEVTAVVTNEGKTDCTINLFVLQTANLALTVVNASGQEIASIPPPTPPPPEEMKKYDHILKPNEQYKFKYRLNIFSRALPNGRYTVYFDEPKSNGLQFVISSQPQKH